VRLACAPARAMRNWSGSGMPGHRNGCHCGSAAQLFGALVTEMSVWSGLKPVRHCTLETLTLVVALVIGMVVSGSTRDRADCGRHRALHRAFIVMAVKARPNAGEIAHEICACRSPITLPVSGGRQSRNEHHAVTIFYQQSALIKRAEQRSASAARSRPCSRNPCRYCPPPCSSPRFLLEHHHHAKGSTTSRRSARPSAP